MSPPDPHVDGWDPAVDNNLLIYGDNLEELPTLDAAFSAGR